MADQLGPGSGVDDWRRRAACAGKSPDLFFPPQGEAGGGEAREWSADAAVAVCAACPVRADCLAEALSRREKWGVWGGVDLGSEARRRHAARINPVIGCKQCGNRFRRDANAGRVDYCTDACAAEARRVQQRRSREGRVAS